MRPGLWRIPGPQTWQPAEGERQGAGILFASLKHSSWRGCSYIAGGSRGPLAGSARAGPRPGARGARLNRLSGSKRGTL